MLPVSLWKAVWEHFFVIETADFFGTKAEKGMGNVRYYLEPKDEGFKGKFGNLKRNEKKRKKLKKCVDISFGTC